MTKENVPDTHKLLEHLDVLVMKYNGKLQVFFKLPSSKRTMCKVYQESLDLIAKGCIEY